MVEIATGLACLSLFLLWRLYVVSRHLRMADIMLRGIVDGKVEIRRTNEGLEMEIKKP
jgi:hypothetical protein